MPTLRQLEEALSRDPSKDAERPLSDLFRAPPLDPDVFRWRAEKESAPIEARDALLAVLAEARATTRLVRWTLVVAVLALVVSLAGIVIALLGA